jgi:hypothetical protein
LIEAAQVRETCARPLFCSPADQAPPLDGVLRRYLGGERGERREVAETANIITNAAGLRMKIALREPSLELDAFLASWLAAGSGHTMPGQGSGDLV